MDGPGPSPAPPSENQMVLVGQVLGKLGADIASAICPVTSGKGPLDIAFALLDVALALSQASGATEPMFRALLSELLAERAKHGLVFGLPRGVRPS